MRFVFAMAFLELFSRPNHPAKALACSNRDPQAIVVPEYAVPPVQPDDEETPIFDRPVGGAGENA